MQDKIKMRRLKDCIEDYKCLEKWYQEKEIYSQFEQRTLTLEEIKNKYYKRTLENAKVPVYMICYEDVPVGIIQHQMVDKKTKDLYKISIDNVYEIDIFIGELQLHNKGIGKICIDLISKYLFEEKNANLLVMCPLKDNIIAIKCYENAGFAKKNEFITNNTICVLQEYVLMVKEKM